MRGGKCGCECRERWKQERGPREVEAVCKERYGVYARTRGAQHQTAKITVQRTVSVFSGAREAETKIAKEAREREERKREWRESVLVQVCSGRREVAYVRCENQPCSSRGAEREKVRAGVCQGAPNSRAKGEREACKRRCDSVGAGGEVAGHHRARVRNLLTNGCVVKRCTKCVRRHENSSKHEGR